MPDREQQRDLTKALEQIDQEIAELNERIPPHSVKPHFIQQLDELEARRDQIAGELDRLGQAPHNRNGESANG